MALPCVILVAVFYYGPLYGWLMAFFRYSPSKGILGSEFVGLYYFKQFFSDPDVGMILRNTVAMSGSVRRKKCCQRGIRPVGESAGSDL